MIFLLAGIAVALTYAMFAYKERLLGFPSGIFWAVLGGHAYTLSTATWDIEYFLFFSSLGMFIFCIYGAFALKLRDIEPTEADWDDSRKFIDEKGKETTDAPMTDTEKESDMGENNPPSETLKRFRENRRERMKERRIFAKAKWH
jgi:hypothetical protein